ncbi:hypothetical protein ERJ75_001142100 [Trypanosoma vivax]|nr:hypothetical protein ERJ75_001142100 [Trypanosoma vivax]
MSGARASKASEKRRRTTSATDRCATHAYGTCADSGDAVRGAAGGSGRRCRGAQTPIRRRLGVGGGAKMRTKGGWLASFRSGSVCGKGEVTRWFSRGAPQRRLARDEVCQACVGTRCDLLVVDTLASTLGYATNGDKASMMHDKALDICKLGVLARKAYFDAEAQRALALEATLSIGPEDAKDTEGADTLRELATALALVVRHTRRQRPLAGVRQSRRLGEDGADNRIAHQHRHTRGGN